MLCERNWTRRNGKQQDLLESMAAGRERFCMGDVRDPVIALRKEEKRRFCRSGHDDPLLETLPMSESWGSIL